MVSNYIKISTVVDNVNQRRSQIGFKLHQNFYCCRSFCANSGNKVSNYIKISTVVDCEIHDFDGIVSNYIKISTVVDSAFILLLSCFKLHQNFYCCRLNNNEDIVYGFKLHQNFYCCRLCVQRFFKIGFKLHQNFYCCRLEARVIYKHVSNYIKISTVVDFRIFWK